MRFLRSAIRPWVVVAGIAAMVPLALRAEPAHGIAMYGEPALPPDFVSLPYANPDAPKGGRIVFGEVGGFDSLNPYILAGNAPFGIGTFVVESLMGRNWDEPFTLYGTLAESVETGPERDWVEFTLRPAARFSDGSPVTVEDVIWSLRTLGEQGHPRYRTAWAKVASIEPTGERGVRIAFTEADRELPLLMGLRPVLKKAQWEGRDFTQSGIAVVPIGSGPYVLDRFNAGRSVVFRRDPDWWGADLPFFRGQHNLDEIRYEYFADGDVAFEAFKAGELSTFREGSAAKWAAQYDFPAVRSGDVAMAEIPHQRPSGMTGLVMNTRRDLFADWRVREAMIQAFPFEFVNQTLNGGTQPRIASAFANSELGMQPGPAEGRVAELLQPFAAELPPGTLEGYTLPVSDGTERNRGGIAEAARLLAEAGWAVANGVLRDAAGEPFSFEILLDQSGPASQRAEQSQQIADIYASALGRLGIDVRIRSTDSAQHKERTERFDFDMAWLNRSLSLSPGNEQYLYWGKAAADTPGSRNLMGVRSDAIDAMIDAMVSAKTRDEFVAATRALDRLLAAGRYVIPIWYSDVSRIAHAAELRFPETTSIYGDWTGFQPDVWWYEE